MHITVEHTTNIALYNKRKNDQIQLNNMNKKKRIEYVIMTGKNSCWCEKAKQNKTNAIRVSAHERWRETTFTHICSHYTQTLRKHELLVALGGVQFM